MKLSADACAVLLAGDATVVCLDVRTACEYEEDGHIDGAVNIPLHGILTQGCGAARTTPILCVCAGGVRSASAALLLRDAGYTQVYELAGGYTAWVAAGLPVVSALVLG